MANEINLGTFCVQGRYFSAILSMQDDAGQKIPCSPEMQTASILKLYRETIEKMLQEGEKDSNLKTPEYIDDDGVKYAEGFRDHTSRELQDRWDMNFAAESDRIRFDKLTDSDVKKAQQQVIRKVQQNQTQNPPGKLIFEPLEKLVLRYEKDRISHNYRDQKTLDGRLIFWID